MSPIQAAGIFAIIYFLPALWWSMAVTHWSVPTVNDHGQVEVTPGGSPMLKQIFLEVTVLEAFTRRWSLRLLVSLVVSMASKLITG